MKKLAIMTGCIAMLASCTQQRPDAVDNPEVLYSSAANTLDLTRVEMTDSSTVLHFNATFRPGWWIQIAKEAFVVADGDTIAMTSAEGIVPGEEHYMPESGKDSFTLTFGPISPKATSLTFNEGTGGWIIAGIDLTGKGVKLPSLPSSVTKAEKGDMTIDPVFEVGETTINFNVLGYDPAMGNKLAVMVYGTGMITPTENSVILDENGKGTLTTTLYGTSTINTYFESVSNTTPASILAAPGETIDIFIDPRFTNLISRERLGLAEGESHFYIHSTGRYAPLNLALQETSKHDVGISVFDTEKFADAWKMTPEEYADFVLDLRDRKSATIDSLDVDPAVKQHLHNSLNADALFAFTDAPYAMVNSFYMAHPEFKGNAHDSIASLTDAEYLKAAKAINPSDPSLFASYNGASALADIDWSKYDGGEEAGKFRNYEILMAKASQSTLSDEQHKELAALNNPFYTKAVTTKEQETIERLKELEKLISPTPEVADDALFDAIVAPYKGKVVLVDLWNTWCGPCRAALKANEPLKSGELANDDIVWVYIADESSDPAKYAAMLPDIKGTHFRVNQNQISEIRKRFNVDGIPFYILVDRDGNATGHPDFRDHSKLVDGIKGAL